MAEVPEWIVPSIFISTTVEAERREGRRDPTKNRERDRIKVLFIAERT
jgi:hypothetical protein